MTQSEKARTSEIGASYDRTDLFRSGDSFAIKANLYKTDLWDVTSYTISGSTTIFADRIETEGLELEASYAMDSGLYFDLNTNISRGTEFQPGGTTTAWRGIAADNLQFTVGKKFGEELDLSWEVVADKRFDDGVNVVAGFGVHHLRATYKPQTGVFKGSEIRVGIENVFDKDYTRRLSTRPAPGRNFKVSFATTF